MNTIIKLIDEGIFSNEELGQIAANVLNKQTLTLDTFEAFWKELDESNKDELYSRILDAEQS